jgi:hypothetical protein
LCMLRLWGRLESLTAEIEAFIDQFPACGEEERVANGRVILEV